MATIGADPEFVIISGGRGVAARDIIRPNPGLDTDWGGVGMDGSGGPLELRPRPSFRPAEVVGNIGRLLGKCLDILPTGAYICVGAYESQVGGLGGHIHAWGRGKTRAKLDDRLNKAKICVGASLLWSLEDMETGILRRRRGYGGINDVRRSQPTMEFRSPSSDWLAFPSLANSSLMFFQMLVDRVGEYGQDESEIETLLADAIRYWESATPMAQRHAYWDKLVNFVKPVARAKDLNTILFFANKLHAIRENGLVRLDIDKWRRRAGCVD